MSQGRPIDFIICAAGEGSRLREAFGGLPKPLIQVNGRSLLSISLDSLDIFPGDRLLIVAQKKHGIRDRLQKRFLQRYLRNEVVWIELDRLTSGQLETALLAKPHLRPDAGIAIFNSDTYSRSVELGSWMRKSDSDGMILCQENNDPSQTHFSFARTNGDDRVVEVAEKKRISVWASVGLYYFKDLAIFSKYAEAEMASSNGLKEKYVIPAYNRMIQDGLDVRVLRAETFLPMGTEQDLKTYWNLDVQKLKAENPPGTIIIDLDGTLTLEDPSKDYADKLPNRLVIERLREYKNQGFQVIIHTARRMRTHASDEARVIRDVGLVTLQWLAEHNVPYDGIRFGKPFGEKGMIIDDMAIRPIEFLQMSMDEIQKRMDDESELLAKKCRS